MYRMAIEALPQGLCPNFEYSGRLKESLIFYPNAGFRLLTHYETAACGTENLTSEGYVCPKCRALATQRKVLRYVRGTVDDAQQLISLRRGAAC